MITACYHKGKSNGVLRVSTTGNCGKKERALSWNQQGPQGQQGQQGPPGPAGATNVVVRTQSFPIGNGAIGGPVQCASGGRATGGGLSLSSSGAHGSDVMLVSNPIDANGAAASTGETPTGWYAILDSNGTPPGATVTVYAVCAMP